MDTQTRHALKHDNFTEITQSGVEWLQENRAKAIPLAIAAVAVIAIGIILLVIYNQRSATAELAFGQAMDTYSAPLAKPGAAAAPGQQTFATAAARAKLANQQFADVASRYGMLEPGKNARYFAGLTAIEMDQPGAAENDLEQVAGYHNANLAALAKLALANLYQQTGRTSQAVVLYQQLIAKPTTTVPASSAQLQLASLYQVTNPAEARRIYTQLKDDKTAAGQIAMQKLQGK